MQRPKLWFKFKGPDGAKWSVYLTTRKISPKVLKHEGVWVVGVTIFEGRNKNKIYIDAGQPVGAFFDTVFHELFHVATRPLGLASTLDEAFVSETSSRLSPILEQLGVQWPAI